MFFRTSDANSPANRPANFFIADTTIQITTNINNWIPRTYSKTLTTSQPYLWATICQENVGTPQSFIKVRNAQVTMTCDTS